MYIKGGSEVWWFVLVIPDIQKWGLRGIQLEASPSKNVQDYISINKPGIVTPTCDSSYVRVYIGRRIMVQASPGQKCKTLLKKQL
jgi:hypothetical protein